MIEPGHYLAVLLEHRMPVSQGANFEELANLFMLRSCIEAFNFDGGKTAVMCFMGKMISSTDMPRKLRNMSELIGVGTSQQVFDMEDP